MNSEKWVHDNERLHSVAAYNELKSGKPKLFSGYPFYSIQYSESEVARRDISRKFDNETSKENLSKVKSIWSYFYRKDPQESTNPDGIIEQWEFESTAHASKAFNEIKAIGMFVFFNTQPYYFQNGNYVFIFHTRAMAFSFEQKSIFEKLESISTAHNTTQKKNRAR